MISAHPSGTMSSVSSGGRRSLPAKNRSKSIGSQPLDADCCWLEDDCCCGLDSLEFELVIWRRLCAIIAEVVLNGMDIVDRTRLGWILEAAAGAPLDLVPVTAIRARIRSHGGEQGCERRLGIQLARRAEPADAIDGLADRRVARPWRRIGERLAGALERFLRPLTRLACEGLRLARLWLGRLFQPLEQPLRRFHERRREQRSDPAPAVAGRRHDDIAQAADAGVEGAVIIGFQPCGGRLAPAPRVVGKLNASPINALCG